MTKETTTSVLLPTNAESAALMVQVSEDMGTGTAAIRYDGTDPAQIDPGVTAYGDYADALQDLWTPDRTRDDYEAYADRVLRAGGAIVELSVAGRSLTDYLVTFWLNNMGAGDQSRVTVD